MALGFSSIFWNTAWTNRQPPHTLGILCDPAHPALAAFPTEYHSNWQWWYKVSQAQPYAGRACRQGPESLTLGCEVPPDRRTLALAPGPGISRLHCSISLADGAAWLEDHSTYGTFLNGERVGGRVELRAGDRIRAGSPGVECELVRAVEDDGSS